MRVSHKRHVLHPREGAATPAARRRLNATPDVKSKYRRVVANDHTVRVGATILQLPPGPGRRGYAGRRIEVQLLLDGRIVVWDGERELLTVPAPPDPVQLRALEAARVKVGSAAPSAATSSGAIPAADHPWRRMPINARRQSTRLTESRSR